MSVKNKRQFRKSYSICGISALKFEWLEVLGANNEERIDREALAELDLHAFRESRKHLSEFVSLLLEPLVEIRGTASLSEIGV